MQLTGKVAIVTGAARGLGRAYSEALAAEGAAVVAADLHDCSATVTAIEAAGGQALSAVVDVANGEQLSSHGGSDHGNLWADRHCDQQCRTVCRSSRRAL